MTESAWRVAYKRNGLTRDEKRLNQCDRILIFREIPHRTVTTRVEDRIELRLRDVIEPYGGCKLRFGRRVRLKRRVESV